MDSSMNSPQEFATTNHDSALRQGSDDAVVELPSRWIAAALSGHECSRREHSSIAGGGDPSLQKEKWSGMRLVDTVVLDDSGDIEYWLFTAKTGDITSKKRARDRVKIAERFERFALANPRNTERYVALASNSRGREPHERVVLGKTALLKAMAGPQVPEELLGATLQCYLRPLNGSNSCLRGCYRGRNQPCAVLGVTPLYQLPTSEVSAERTASPRESPIPDDFPRAVKVRSEVERVLASLVAFLEPQLIESEQQQQQTIRGCDADFIIDDNGELWMTSLPRVTMTAAAGMTSETIPPISYAETSSSSSPVNDSPSGKRGEHDGDGGVVATALESAHTMPPLGAPSAQQVAPVDGGGSPLGSERGSKISDVPPNESPVTVNSSGRLDQDKPFSGRALPAISTMLGARSDQGDHNELGSLGGRQGETTPIIEKKGGVYVANLHASALRGLCCWRKCPDRSGGSSLRGRESPRWQLVEGRYKGNLAGEERRSIGGADVETLLKGASSPASFDELSKIRLKMTARSVLLAISSASFLRGDEPLKAERDSLGVDNDSNGVSLARRWRGCDQRAQLSLARANPQAYYDEATVCGNCMEICQKLDSIRNSGFPDGDSGGANGTFSRDSYLDPLRPSSEPLPDPISATTSEKGRPGTAAAGIDVSLATEKDQRLQSRSPSSPEEQCNIDGVKGRGDDTCGSPSVSASVEGSTSHGGGGSSENGVNPMLEPATQHVDNGKAKHGLNDHGIMFEGSRELPTAQAGPRGVNKATHTRREKARSTTKAIDRLSGVYSDNTSRGGGAGKPKRNHRAGAAMGHRGKARTISDGIDGRSSTNGEIPSVAALARFAIERERMAREMGVDELGGPATLGVVNVGARSQNQGRTGKGDGGSKRARNQWKGRNLNNDGGSGGGEESLVVGADKSSVRAETRSAGEMLLEKLESVAEARSIESAGGLHDGDGRTFHGNCPIEESSMQFNEYGMGGGGWGAVPAGVELSTTESAFLERSRRFNPDGSVSLTRVDPLFGDHFEAGFRERSDGGNGGGGSGGGGAGQIATIGALRDRLAVVEGENTALRARAHKAEEERATEAARGDRASKKLAQTRTEFSRAMSEKEEDHRRKELALQEKHSRDLATKSQALAEEMAQQPQSGEGVTDEEGDGRGTLGVRGRTSSKSLIGRLEQALKEMTDQQQRFALDKRALLAEKTQEVASAEAKGRRELQESRSLAAAMEDRASSLQEQVAEAAKQISTLSAKESEQRRRRQRAEEESDKIRKDISVLRQTVQASQSMDVTDESGGRRDAQSTLAAVTATSEARIRTLNNKVDFLKAQLASEQTLKAEVEAALALSGKSVAAAKDNGRRQAAESEKARELAVEEAVARVRRQLEESMSENYRVQSKVQALQDQLSDALGDVSTARRREEALKAEGALTAAKLKDRSTELAKAQSRADDLAEARAADTESSSDRAAREAVIRRLENERQYLKNQLESEITCKDELREALGTATRQLGEIKVDWAEEQTSRTDEFQRELQAKYQAMSDLNAEKVAMEAEVVSATRQLELLKEGYSKARDNLRAEQSALETARTANRRLREEVKATAEELAATKTQQGENARRHSQSLVAAKSALDESDESKRKQGVEQQMQLRAQLLKTGEVQRQLMLLQDQLAGQKRESDRMLAVERLGQGLARWSKNRKAHALSRLFAGSAMVAAENDVRERTCRALREAGEGACRAQQTAVEEARRVAALMAEEALAEAGRAFAGERSTLLEDADAAAAVAATQVQTIEELRTLEASTRRELEKTRAEAKESSRRSREQSEKAAQEAEEQARARIEAAIVGTEEACAEASKTAKEESDERWRAVLRKHLQNAGEEAAAAAAAASLEHDSLLEETQQAFRIERVRLREEAELLAVAATEEERKRGIEREIDSRAAGAAEAAAAAALTREEDRRVAENNLSEALAVAAERAKSEAGVARLLEEEARKIVVTEAAAERAQLEKELAKARERAVKLEGGKWQRASEEAEARASAEQVAAYERGVADRGRRAELEAAQLQDAAEKALEEVKLGARVSIEEMVARHSEEVEAENKRVSEEQAIVRKDAVKAAMEELTKSHIKALANARETATAEARGRAERERAAAVEAAKERERLATDKAKDELRSAKTEWTAERRRLKEESARLEEAEQKAKDELLRAMANSSQATQRARARWETGQKVAMEKAAAEAVEEREKALEEARRAFGREKKRALLENQEAFTAQAEAMTDRLQKQAAVSLQQAKDLHAETQKEKDQLSSELTGCRKVLKESEATLMRFEEDGKEHSLSSSLRNWKLATAALQLRVQHKKSMEALRTETAQRESEAEKSFEEEKLALSATVEELLELAFDSRTRFAEMQETLVNHKREVLIDHKVQSSSLHKELDSLARDREQLEDKRVAIHREFREMEGQAKDAEKAAHAHSRQSAIGPDGMIIPARARKKRRLDEELEGLLEAMEAKRKALAAMDSKLAALAESRSVKDDEMKGLERTLVQVLVEQQKKLLALLSEAGEKTKQLEHIHEKTRFARDEAKRRRAQLQRQQRELGEIGG